MDPRPSRMPWLVPYLAVRSIERSTEFYSKAFGFKSKGMKDHNGHVNHINFFHKNTVLFMIHPEGAMGSPARSPSTANSNASQTFYVFVDNVDKFYEKAISNGCRSIVSPEDFYWGDRMCQVVDPDGYSWAFAKELKKKTAGKKKKGTTKKKTAGKKKKGTTKKTNTKKITKAKTATKKPAKKPAKRKKLKIKKKS